MTNLRQGRCLLLQLLFIIIVPHIIRLVLWISNILQTSILLKWTTIVMIVWLVSDRWAAWIWIISSLIMWLLWWLRRDSFHAILISFCRRKFRKMRVDVARLVNVIENMRFILVSANITWGVTCYLASVNAHSQIFRLSSIFIICAKVPYWLLNRVIRMAIVQSQWSLGLSRILINWSFLHLDFLTHLKIQLTLIMTLLCY